MSNTHLIAVIVEWSQLNEAPTLIVAPNTEEATRRVVEHIATMSDALVGGLAEWSGAGADWHRQNPAPPARGSALPDLETWLNTLHEFALMPLWTMYAIDLKTCAVSDWLQPGWPPVDAAGPFEIVGEFVAQLNHPPCDTCGKTHKPSDAEHSEVMS